MKKTCPRCGLVNFATAENCLRCKSVLRGISGVRAAANDSLFKSKLLKRAAVLCLVIVSALAGFYLSLVFSAKPLAYEERKAVERAVLILQRQGFEREVFLLNYLTVYRREDNWLNASTRLENAYAATNFPFEIITVYGDFYQFPLDDLERAAILLHEARHLLGEDEKEAYRYVWKNRRRLGWTKENYAHSAVWQHVRKQTREFVPELFVCNINPYDDCTEQ